MSNLSDDTMRKMLQSKFEDYEAPVDPAIWKGIKTNPAAAGTSMGLAKITIGGSLLVMMMTLHQDVFKDQQAAFVQDNHQIEQSFNGDQSDDALQLPRSREVAGSTGDEGNGQIVNSHNTAKIPTSQLPSIGQGPDLVLPAIPESTSSGSRETFSPANPASSDITSDPYQRLISRYPDLPVSSFYDPDDEIEFGDIAEVAPEKYRLLHFQLVNGFTLNYLRFQPNRADSVFIFDEENTVDLSPTRIGFQPRFTVVYIISPKFEIRSSFTGQFQRYQIDFKYQAFNRVGEVNLVQPFEKTFSVLSVGTSLGVSYNLPFGRHDKSIDLDFDFQKVVGEPIPEPLTSFHNNITQLRMGFSYYFGNNENFRWIINPYGQYALNRKHSSAPMQLVPYGFGLGVGIEF